MARGDRRTAILLDEFASVDNGHAALASTGDATNCRIFNSTPKGSGNAFYDVAHGKMKKIRFHWSSHPEKIQDSYVDAAGKTRSPWYDAECERRTSPVEIAQEIDIDYLGSDNQFFDSDALDGIMKKTVCDPYVICNMEGAGGLNPKSLIPSPEGVLRLWVYPDGEDQLPGDREYVAGVDIATGTGGSNSVVSVADRHTAEKVAELATPSVRPDVFAEMTLMLLRWFHDAYVIWEANGPGRIFGDRLIELGYRNIYYRKSDGKLPASSTQFPGWWASGTSKMSLLGDYRRALFSGDFLNRSKIALTECRQIVFAPGGRVVHSRSEITHAPSGAKENHGDRVTADALCWKAVGEVKRPVAEPEQEIIPGSLAWRRSERKKTEKKRRW